MPSPLVPKPSDSGQDLPARDIASFRNMVVSTIIVPAVIHYNRIISFGIWVAEAL